MHFLLENTHQSEYYECVKCQSTLELLFFYFIARDLTLPFLYAYGIRENAAGQIRVVRTDPLLEINTQHKIIITCSWYYALGEMMTEPAETACYVSIFKGLNMPLIDNELVVAPVVLTPL